MSAHPAGTSWPPGWSTKVKAEPGAQPVQVRCQNWAIAAKLPHAGRAAVDPAPELDPVEDPAFDRLVLLPALERHRVVAPAMGEQQFDRAGAAGGLATPEAAGDRAVGGVGVRVVAGELPDHARPHREAGDEHAVAVEVEARGRIVQHAGQERRLVPHRRPRAERPEEAVAARAGQAGRRQQHVAPASDRRAQIRDPRPRPPPSRRHHAGTARPAAAGRPRARVGAAAK